MTQVTTFNGIQNMLADAQASHYNNIKELVAYMELKKFICKKLNYDIKTFVLLDVREEKYYYDIIFRTKKTTTFCKINKLTRILIIRKGEKS